jgi:hypothetical protein
MIHSIAPTPTAQSRPEDGNSLKANETTPAGDKSPGTNATAEGLSGERFSWPWRWELSLAL